MSGGTYEAAGAASPGEIWELAHGVAAHHGERRVLGPAHVKDPGKRTARGAIDWRTADGPKPSDERLEALLRDEKEKRRRVGAQPVRTAGRTFGDALDAYRERCKRDGKAETTMRG